MAKYRMMVTYEEGGFFSIHADSEEEAKDMAEELVNEEGLEALGGYESTHRAYVVYVEEEIVE